MQFSKLEFTRSVFRSMLTEFHQKLTQIETIFYPEKSTSKHENPVELVKANIHNLNLITELEKYRQG